MSYDHLYVKFVYFFNVERDYYECHEVMEELWLEEGRNSLYQGLLQVAVGLYHYRNGNPNGARKLMQSGLDKLAIYGDMELGIDLGLLRREVIVYLHQLNRYVSEPFLFYDLTLHILDDKLAREVEAMRRSREVGNDD